MKKLFAIFALTTVLASCGTQETTETPAVDTTAVAPTGVTEVAVDTTAAPAADTTVVVK